MDNLEISEPNDNPSSHISIWKTVLLTILFKPSPSSFRELGTAGRRQFESSISVLFSAILLGLVLASLRNPDSFPVWLIIWGFLVIPIGILVFIFVVYRVSQRYSGTQVENYNALLFVLAGIFSVWAVISSILAFSTPIFPLLPQLSWIYLLLLVLSAVYGITQNSMLQVIFVVLLATISLVGALLFAAILQDDIYQFLTTGLKSGYWR